MKDSIAFLIQAERDVASHGRLNAFMRSRAKAAVAVSNHRAADATRVTECERRDGTYGDGAKVASGETHILIKMKVKVAVNAVVESSLRTDLQGHAVDSGGN